jgi:hypothetical protein
MAQRLHRPLHPIIHGFYQAPFEQATAGNGTGDGKTVINEAIRRAIAYRDAHNADIPALWEREAVRHTILAAHCARALGLLA